LKTWRRLSIGYRSAAMAGKNLLLATCTVWPSYCPLCLQPRKVWILLHIPGTASKGSNSDEVAQSKEWKSLWSIQCPGKMKIVLWRMAHDCLPTGVQLQCRHIPAKDAYVLRGRSESVEHFFLLCPFDWSVWDSVKEYVPIKLCRKSFRNMKQCMFKFLNRASDI
jgi:hypothetical protein